ncbi:class I SAM-dependent methyltransferase [Singulisphaera sp. Ch08]|uniref:Class I SAM-dependent methyltransferase n=1 Tax=Singulisphaera sp. Ch08 TaxID=3120278 RepID=A0AAU7CFH8_9BACT
MNPYRSRVFSAIRSILGPHAPSHKALDFGSGDGWFSRKIQEEGLATEVISVDVKQRPHSLVDPLVYDGVNLPFENGSFDLVYAIDVLHHCPDPRQSLKEMLRCSRGLILLKDHNYCGTAGWLTLALLDELGNRRFGIPSPHRYQRDWEWFPEIEAGGFAVEEIIHPAICHTGLLGWATNGLQFIGLWRREPS